MRGSISSRTSRSAKSILIAMVSPSSFRRARKRLRTCRAGVPYDVPSVTPGSLSASLHTRAHDVPRAVRLARPLTCAWTLGCGSALSLLLKPARSDTDDGVVAGPDTRPIDLDGLIRRE